eukprot:ctg_3098.g544
MDVNGRPASGCLRKQHQRHTALQVRDHLAEHPPLIPSVAARQRNVPRHAHRPADDGNTEYAPLGHKLESTPQKRQREDVHIRSVVAHVHHRVRWRRQVLAAEHPRYDTHGGHGQTHPQHSDGIKQSSLVTIPPPHPRIRQQHEHEERQRPGEHDHREQHAHRIESRPPLSSTTLLSWPLHPPQCLAARAVALRSGHRVPTRSERKWDACRCACVRACVRVGVGSTAVSSAEEGHATGDNRPVRALGTRGVIHNVDRRSTSALHALCVEHPHHRGVGGHGVHRGVVYGEVGAALGGARSGGVTAAVGAVAQVACREDARRRRGLRRRRARTLSMETWSPPRRRAQRILLALEAAAAGREQRDTVVGEEDVRAAVSAWPPQLPLARRLRTPTSTAALFQAPLQPARRVPRTDARGGARGPVRPHSAACAATTGGIGRLAGTATAVHVRLGRSGGRGAARGRMRVRSGQRAGAAVARPAVGLLFRVRLCARGRSAAATTPGDGRGACVRLRVRYRRRRARGGGAGGDDPQHRGVSTAAAALPLRHLCVDAERGAGHAPIAGGATSGAHVAARRQRPVARLRCRRPGPTAASGVCARAGHRPRIPPRRRHPRALLHHRRVASAVRRRRAAHRVRAAAALGGGESQGTPQHAPPLGGRQIHPTGTGGA